MQMRGDSEAASFRGDRRGDTRGALPQAQPPGSRSAHTASLPGLSRRGLTKRGETDSKVIELLVLGAPNSRIRPRMRQYNPF